MAKPDNEFFVGYLPTPPRVRRVLVVSAAGIVLVAVCLGIAIASTQSDPGSAQWDLSRERSIEGIVRSSPYPSIVNDAGARTVIVSEGKRGASDRAASLEGKRVQLRGYSLSRDGTNMLELLSSADAIKQLDANIHPPPLNSPGERVTLRGEIVDSKCYLGAMKPGEGKPHKACAALCLRGGIPPMFVTVDATGKPIKYLLTDEHGNAFAGEALDDVLSFVADPIVIEGRIVPMQDLPYFYADIRSIRRW